MHLAVGCTRACSEKPFGVPAKRSQNINTTYPNIVGPAFASSGQTIATLIGLTCRTRFATLLRCVATCWVLKIKLVRMPGCNEIGQTTMTSCNIHFQISQHPTCRNRSQQGGKTRSTCCAQQWGYVTTVQMFRSFGRRGFICWLNLTLTPPHTSRFFVSRQKIFTCRLVCREFRQVCDKIGACQTISDSARSQNVLSGLVG